MIATTRLAGVAPGDAATVFAKVKSIVLVDKIASNDHKLTLIATRSQRNVISYV